MSSTTPATSTEPTASDLKTFVSTAFNSYKSNLEKFSKISGDSSLNDDAKSNQASIYLSDVATSIASDYIASNPGFVDDGSLTYNITMFLLSDGRVGKAIALPGSDWDNLENLPQFADVPSFTLFVKAVQGRDALKKEMGCCW